MELSRSTQDFLKVVWAATEWCDNPVTPSVVARRLGLKLSTVSGTFTKLTTEGLAARSESGSILLTEAGRKHALQMIRRHRLIETFLLEQLHYPLEMVHAEAENLEHTASDFLINQIDELLGHPTRDPHGDPIPDRDGVLTGPQARVLWTVPPGEYGVERIDDGDAELVSFFSEFGITLGRRITVAEGEPYSDTVHVHTDSGRSTALGRRAAEAIWVA